MIKKTFYSLLFLTLLTTNSYSAGSDSTSKVKSNYTQAVTLIKAAKKYEKKGKIEKANKRYKKAQALLIKSNKKKPLQHLQVKINQKELLKNKRGDLLDSYAYREEDREKVVARAETLLSENYKVIYSVPDEKNREFKNLFLVNNLLNAILIKTINSLI